ncbi:hypothetical protein DFQ28_008595 [Apophysomyces sp. BC1034]|nr:hypothetical protein DFQ29_009601 [Apophysomyces sp. BC1021]KAG0192597.1 hypothetical protein DFQ28_008595 [Apophysomyces sp. BC1034]
MECKINSAADIPSEWVQGIHVGGRRARRQAVQVDHNGPLYLYPEDALSISDGVILRKYTLAESKYKKMGFLPHELPLPGTKEFKEAATITAEKINNQLQNQVSTSSIDIPRRCVMFSPSTLQATEEFEQAVLYALQMSDNYSKFSALQYVFQEFGYYYPYWIVLGG